MLLIAAWCVPVARAESEIDRHCEAMKLQSTEWREEAAFEVARAQRIVDSHRRDGADSPSTRARRDISTLELRRAQLELRAAEARHEVFALSCADPSGIDLAIRHRIENRVRRWRQWECHRMGKDLAIAEIERDRLAPEGPHAADIASRIDFYKPRIDACIASGRGSAEVRFATADGGIVHAWLEGGGRRGIVLAHGGRFTKESWGDQIPILVEAGFRVLAIDFRGRGRSRGPDDAVPDSEHHDVLAAVRYLRETGSTSVSVIGASFGGGAAAQAAVEAEPGEIDALVLLAHSVIEDSAGIKGRKLFMVARDDVRGGGVRRLDEIRRQFDAAPEPKELVVLEGEAHAQFLFDTDQAKRLMRTILDFLSAGS